jgi:nitrite reductase/ring-hydroxylating ferredoxin subunit
VLVVRDGDRLLAMADRCTHRGGPLHEGDLVTGGVPGVGGRNAGVGGVNGCVECPWHQSRFRLEDGAIEAGPATFPQPRYEVRVRGDALEVRAAAGVARRG